MLPAKFKRRRQLGLQARVGGRRSTGEDAFETLGKALLTTSDVMQKTSPASTKAGRLSCCATINIQVFVTNEPISLCTARSTRADKGVSGQKFGWRVAQQCAAEGDMPAAVAVSDVVCIRHYIRNENEVGNRLHMNQHPHKQCQKSRL